MAKNLELKARILSIPETETAALQCGASFSTTLHQTDTYFVVPHGRLKLREIAEEGAEVIFYERPEERPERWSTYEKVPVSDAHALKAALEHALGIKAVVKKTRLVYQYRQCRIHLDTVDGLGTFLEFEVQDSTPGDSGELMKYLRGAFQIKPEDIVRASYSDLLIGKNNRF